MGLKNSELGARTGGPWDLLWKKVPLHHHDLIKRKLLAHGGNSRLRALQGGPQMAHLSALRSTTTKVDQ